jgi:Mor family transcriptional regulator
VVKEKLTEEQIQALSDIHRMVLAALEDAREQKAAKLIKRLEAVLAEVEESLRSLH